ncbi:hypothetical protein Q9W60_002675 [Salmonella enterica]|nr:hypothetical protein [Salmonella enterica]
MWLQGSTVWTKQTEGSGALSVFKESFSLSSLAPDLVDRVKEHCQDLISLERFRETFSTARKLRYSDTVEMVRQIEELGEFQFANAALQPFLVAMPEYRKLYNDGMATGYENGFSRLDVFKGNAYMRTDDHFREATSGISTKYDEDKIWQWATNEDRAVRLSRIDKVDIQLNWARMSAFDWEDGDPCSELGATC